MGDHPELLSPEREKLFSLLKSLLERSGEGVILEGPKGIGKSFFLKRLQEALGERLVLLRGEAELERFPYREKAGRIIAIDDGDTLPPGVLEELYRYWRSTPDFSWIVALTPEGLFLKEWTDRKAVEALKLFQIPPLSPTESERYLLKLLKQRGLDPELFRPMLAYLFEQSQGVPGRIEALLSQALVSDLPKSRARPYPLYAAALLATVALFALLWWLGEPPPRDLQRSPPKEALLPDGERARSPQAAGARSRALPQEGGVSPAEPLPVAEPKPEPKGPPEGAAPSTPEPAFQERSSSEESEEEASGVEESQKEQYTLQLAAFRTKERAERFLKQYPQLQGAEIRQSLSGGKRWFVVLYGRYATLEEAREAARTLPKGISPWIRKLSPLASQGPQ